MTKFLYASHVMKTAPPSGLIADDQADVREAYGGTLLLENRAGTRGCEARLRLRV